LAFNRASEHLGRKPVEIKHTDHHYTMMFTFRGTNKDVERKIAAADKVVEKCGGVRFGESVTAKFFWERRFSGLPLHFWKSGRIAQGAVTVPLRMPKIRKAAYDLAEKFGMRREDFWFGCNPVHPNYVLMRFLYAFDEKDPVDKRQAQAFNRELQKVFNDLGAPTYRIGTGFNPYLKTESIPDYYRFLRIIKRALDPNNIMHPGSILLDLKDDDI